MKIYTNFINKDPLLTEVKDIMAIVMHPSLYKDEKIIIKDSRIHLSLKQLNIPIRKDATSSVYQLLSVLANDRMIAKSTNIINSGYIVDIYKTMLEDLDKYMDDMSKNKSYSKIKYKTIMNKSMNTDLNSMEIKSDIQSNKPVIKDDVDFNIVHQLYNNIRSRNFIKKLLIPLPYGVTSKRMTEIIQNICDETYIEKNLPKPDKTTCSQLSYIIYYNFYKKYTNIYDIKDFLGSLGRLAAYLETALIWDWGHGKVYQKYLKESKKQFTLYSYDIFKGKNVRKTIHVSAQEYKADKNKANQATPANIKHSLDAAIIAGITLKIKEDYNKIPIATIHDCITSIGPMSGIISKEYFKTVINIINNPIKFYDNTLYMTFEQYVLPNNNEWNDSCFTIIREALIENKQRNDIAVLDNVIEKYNKYKKIYINNKDFIKEIESGWDINKDKEHGPYRLSY
nr:hypothetical protein [Oedogonium sp. 210]